MGAGDGLLIRELLKYPDIESIVHVDLDRKLVELAQTDPVLVAMNEGALDDPRVRTYFDDAYRYIRNSNDAFDAIYLDFPKPNDYNLSKLYSREFFSFVRQRLAPGGFVVLDTPGLKNRSPIREIYTNTIAAAGFKYIRPYISKIEDNNREAMSILLRSGYSREASRDLLVEHARSLRYGFVMARDSLPEGPSFRDPRVNLHVLPAERLQSTLGSPPPPVATSDPSKVNSIFRPTLPAGKVWEIRSAW
jgi:spermidine synthase